MPDPSTYRPAPGTIPTEPGVYRFSDPSGRVIYVGKAKNLRSRVSSYFQDLYNLHPRTAQMVTTAAKVDWTIVASEVEALQLEYSWIKEFDPRFNVKYRDDKSYPSLAVTMNEQFPRLQVMRGPKRKGVRYFGPYSHAWAIRETLDLLLRVFPARTCSAGVFKRSQQVGRPCLLGYIDKCSAPCVGRVSPEEHRSIVEDFCDFMAGQTRPYVRRLEKEMEQAAAGLDFERAARLRDDVGALNRALEKQTVVLGDGTDADVVAFAQDELEAAVQVFYVRGGRIRGQRGWVVDKVEVATTPELVEQFLTTAYLDEANEIPREVLVPELPPDADVVAELLTELRGAKVDLRVPQRGDKRALADTVRQNAEQSFRLHKLKRAGDLTARSRALEELQVALDLEQAPLRIECYDVSHIQGTDVVASMVVFEDGLPRKSEYRRFAVRGAADGTVPDDTRSMNQVLTRRFARYLAESGGGGATAPTDDSDGLTELPLGRSGVTQQNTPQGGPVDPETGRARKFAYPPQLVVVDGGAPQVAAAAQALAELGIPTHGEGAVALVGLAKRLEEVWLPDEADPVIMPRTSEGLYLLQRLRDEAHRFAITYHRQKRSSSMTRSELDAVPGLGPVRKKALMARFGSVRKLRAATLDEVAEVIGIGPTTAAAVLLALGAEGAGPGPAFDPVTGEVLEDSPTPRSVPVPTSPSSAANTPGADR